MSLSKKIDKEAIKEGRGLSTYSVEELQYIMTPIGKGLYTSSKKWDDILKCDVCGEKYKRAHKYAHKQTKIHKRMENVNNNMKKILLGIDE